MKRKKKYYAKARFSSIGSINCKFVLPRMAADSNTYKNAFESFALLVFKARPPQFPAIAHFSVSVSCTIWTWKMFDNTTFSDIFFFVRMYDTVYIHYYCYPINRRCDSADEMHCSYRYCMQSENVMLATLH